MTRTSIKKWAVDTNILVYLLDANSPFHESTKKTLSHLQKKQINIVVCHQNLVEMVAVLTKHYDLSLKKSVNWVQKILKQNVETITPISSTIKTYVRLCQQHPRAKDHFDLYLAATLIDNGINNLITADRKGFAKIDDLRVFSLENVGDQLKSI